MAKKSIKKNKKQENEDISFKDEVDCINNNKNIENNKDIKNINNSEINKKSNSDVLKKIMKHLGYDLKRAKDYKYYIKTSRQIKTMFKEEELLKLIK